MKLVIIGNGMAADAVLDAWTQRTPTLRDLWDVTVFGDEPGTAYNRVLLVDLLTGRKTADNLLLKTEDWYASQRISLRSRVRIVRIDPEQKAVFDKTGNRTGYDRLLLAVGARPFLPPVPGVSLQGVHVLRTLEDVVTIGTKARKEGAAVVVGGGLLGLEAARGLSDLGMRVRVLHLKDRVMDQQLDTSGGMLLQKELERMGIEIRLNAVFSGVLGKDAAEAVLLENGEQIPADLVLVSAGVMPDTTLAAACGIPVQRGILVDDHLRTGIPEIFAVGDAIEHRGICYGLVAPLREQARVAVHNMTAADGEPPLLYEGTRCATTLKVSGISVTSAGEIHGGEGTESHIVLDSRRGVYRKFVLRGDTLAGAILVGDTQGSPKALRLIESGESLGESRHELFGTAPAGPASAPDDQELVCTCHGITRGTIVGAVKTKGLKSRDEVARYTKASTGCGSCAQTVADIVSQVRLPLPKAAASAPAATAVPSPELPVVRTLLSDYPPAYPKMLEIERIKKEGLGLDFSAIFSKGITAMSEDDFYRLKTYGICSQKHPGFFMIRIRVPGGRLSPEQALAVGDLAERYGNGWAHLSTRQNIELHWVTLKDIPDIWDKLDSVGLSTRSSCGHTMRNVMACPHGSVNPDALADVLPVARMVSDYFVQRSDLINTGLPNRLNIVFSACPECDPDVWINDIGFRVVHDPQKSGRMGFELWTGGSLGAHPVLGFRLKDFLTPDDVLPACQAIFEIYIKHGNRNKARSRLKWLIEQWGKEKFSGVFEQVFRTKRLFPETPRVPFPPLSSEEASSFSWILPRLPEGCFRQRRPDHVRIPVGVPLGEIRGRVLTSLAEALRSAGKGEIQLTREQNFEIQDLPARHATKILKALERAKLAPQKIGDEPHLVACPGTEFCVLAVTDSQGVAHSLLKDLENGPARTSGLLHDATIAVSGCPNSCAKHQIADIGLSGGMTTVGEDRRYAYSLYLGGSMKKEVHLGETILKGLTEEMVIPVLHTLFECIEDDRQGRETLSEVVERLGARPIGRKLEDRLQLLRPKIWEKIRMECQLNNLQASVAGETADTNGGGS